MIFSKVKNKRKKEGFIFARDARKIKRLKYSHRVYPGLLNKGILPWRIAYDYKDELVFIADAMNKEFGRHELITAGA